MQNLCQLKQSQKCDIFAPSYIKKFRFNQSLSGEVMT